MNNSFLALETQISPGVCDINGHMNVAHYALLFDSACWAILDRFGNAEPGLSWADVTHRTEFKKEVHARSEILIRSGLLRVGRKSVTIRNVMIIKATSELAATNEVVTVRFDLGMRAAIDLSEASAAAAAVYLTDT